MSLAKLVKQLREQTGSPMMQCKAALEQNDQDLEKAKEYLKSKGLSSASKYSQKETREGIVGIKISQDSKIAAMMELNCQTDFVARTDSFLLYSKVFLDSLIVSKELANQSKEFTDVDEIKKYTEKNILNEQVLPQADQDVSINEVQTHLIAHLQENINLRRFAHLFANQGIFGSYVHNTLAQNIGLKSCLVELSLENNNESNQQKIRELADNIALQILGNKPQYLTKQDIPKDLLDKEYAMVNEQYGDKLKGKPEQIQKNMIEGKMKKFYEDNVLYAQEFIFNEEDSTRTIEEYIQEIEKEVGDKISIKNYHLWSCQ